MQNVRGDGFCFIPAILTCPQEDDGLSLDMEEIIHIILEKLVQQHNDTAYSDSYVKNKDILVCNAMEFFNSKHYNMDVVDIIIQVYTDALALDI